MTWPLTDAEVWRFVQRLATLPPEDRQAALDELGVDVIVVAQIARRIVRRRARNCVNHRGRR